MDNFKACQVFKYILGGADKHRISCLRTEIVLKREPPSQTHNGQYTENVHRNILVACLLNIC
jgi:hypothetical protein